MNEFYSYLSDADKEFMAIETAFNIDLEKQLLAYEYASKVYDIKVMQSDLKVLTESGTYEDVEFLYGEAGKEAGEKKQGIISSIINKIGSMIQSIIDAIAGLFKGKKEQEVEDDIKSGKIKGVKGIKDPSKSVGIIGKGLNSLKKLIHPGKQIDEETGEKAIGIASDVKKKLAAVGIVSGGAAIAWACWNAYKKGKQEVQEAKQVVDNLKTGLLSGDGAPKLLTAFSDTVSSCGKAISGFLPKLISGKSEETPGQEQDQEQSGNEEAEGSSSGNGRLTDSRSGQQALPDKRANRAERRKAKQASATTTDGTKAIQLGSPDAMRVDMAREALKKDTNETPEGKMKKDFFKRFKKESVEDDEYDMLESEELEDTMSELTELFASL